MMQGTTSLDLIFSVHLDQKKWQFFPSTSTLDIPLYSSPIYYRNHEGILCNKEGIIHGEVAADNSKLNHKKKIAQKMELEEKIITPLDHQINSANEKNMMAWKVRQRMRREY